MAASSRTPSATEPTDPTGARRGVTPARAVVTVLVLLMVALWSYVLYLAIGPGRQDPPDRLADPDFAPAAQAVCSAALDEVAQLPSATEVGTADERADAIEAANEVFAAMVDDLAALAPDGEEGDIVAAWVADWRAYLEDRADYAEDLRDDPAARFFVSTRNNDQMTEYIDAFAADNRIPACSTPLDV